ncbi:hypothetical protein LPE509_00511 [Legionella pneumophila subsp. pneumophila LPE509]|nr:hypothetical protein LPE509_00511 [Legionella pneumophila subsp. pneumophila LPE509]
MHHISKELIFLQTLIEPGSINVLLYRNKIRIVSFCNIF